MPYIESHLTTTDGLSLRTQRWTPEGEPQAVVVLTHGHGEHSGRYVHVGQALSAAGYAVYAYDLRGHGKSGGPRGHTPRYDVLLDDLQLVWGWAEKENPGKKLFIYGHSMGGQITLNFALRRKPQAAGVIVSAPWLTLTYMPPAWKVTLAKVLSNILPTFTQKTGLDAAVKMAHDDAHLNSLPDLNLTHTFMSARMGFDVLAAADDALAHAIDFKYPLLILHGDADGAMNPAGSKQFYERASSTDKTLKLYPGLFHEVHNETERTVVLSDVVGWLERHT
jgi:alpha-beta hydrolase superfamily lysophospholipase